MPTPANVERRSKKRPTMLSDRVVARFLTGETLEGKLMFFDPDTGILKLRTGSGKRELDCSILKAIFFLRDSNRSLLSEPRLRPGGKKVRVVFADGEEITGYSYGLRPREDGFYLYPIQKSGRNERIYVMRKNALKIRTESG
ncbi:MAG: hypothetical protein HY349_07110 [Nitrospirae bacterium]|nr:hypothetical protein [Nitrospirota bacterium]